MFGIGHLNELHDLNPYYLSQGLDYETTIRVHDHGDLQFYVDDERKAYFDSSNNFIIGDELARSKLSIFDGDLRLGFPNRSIKTSIFKNIESNVTFDSERMFQLILNDDVFAKMGNSSLGVHTDSLNSELNLHSDAFPKVYLNGSLESMVQLDSLSTSFNMRNNSGTFMLGDIDHTAISIASNGIGFLTDQPLTGFDIHGHVQMQVFDQLQFVSDDKSITNFSIYTDYNDLNFRLRDNVPLQFEGADGIPILVVSSNGNVGVQSTFESVEDKFVVSGNSYFKGPIYYGTNKQIQAFQLSTTSNSTLAEENKVIYSVQSLSIDDASGLTFSTGNSGEVILNGPSIYGNIYTAESTAIRPKYARDVFEFQEMDQGGVSVNLIDTDLDGIDDAIEFYNTLIDGGDIFGDLEVSGNFVTDKLYGNGYHLTKVPFQWLLNELDLYYISGNVGIRTTSPNYMFDVRSDARIDQVFVNTLSQAAVVSLNQQQLISEDQIMFLLDTDYSQNNFLSINNDTSVLFSLDSSNGNMALFSDTSDAEFHIISPTDSVGMLVYSESGQSSIEFKSDYGFSKFQVNQSNMPSLGGSNESMVVSSKNIILQSNGNQSVFFSDDYVSFGDHVTQNTLYVRSTGVVGSSYAGSHALSNDGLSIEHSLSVGISDSINSSLYSPTMSVRISTSSVLESFSGVYVENTLGVLVSSPNYPVHIDGVVEADEVMFYHPSLDVDNRHRFSLFHYNTFESKHLDVDLHLQLSENDRHLFYANDQLAMSVVSNSVVFGDSSQTVSDLLIINNDSVDLLLESNTSDFDPHVGFIAKSATGSIGINEYGNLFIDPLYSDISFPKFSIRKFEACNQYGVVTIGVYSLAGYSAGCDYQLDVLGTLKSQYLFQRHVNTSGQEETLRMYSTNWWYYHVVWFCE